jgi:hypothetical protein
MPSPYRFPGMGRSKQALMLQPMKRFGFIAAITMRIFKGGVESHC